MVIGGRCDEALRRLGGGGGLNMWWRGGVVKRQQQVLCTLSNQHKTCQRSNHGGEGMGRDVDRREWARDGVQRDARR